MSLSSVTSTLKNFIASKDEIHLANKFLELNKWTCSDTLSIDMAIGILKQNGLSYKQIREIWNVADRKGTGNLARDELTILIRLMGWVQAGKSVDTAFLLDREGPLPTIKGINDKIVLEVQKDPDFGAQPRESHASDRTARIQHSSIKAREQKADHIFEVIPVTEDDLVIFEQIFMASKPINGYLHKRDIMAIYMDDMPELSFDQLYKIMSVLQVSSAGDIDFTNFVTGLYVVRGLKDGTLSCIPTSIAAEIQKLSLHLMGRQNNYNPKDFAKMNSQSFHEASLDSAQDTELPQDVEHDIEDLVKDIQRVKCISTSMCMSFKRKYEILPAELSQMWKESDAKSEYLIDDERLAAMQRLLRLRLSKKLPGCPMPIIPSSSIRPLPSIPLEAQPTGNPPPPQYRSRMYPTPLVVYNGIIDEITKSTRQLDQIIKDQERSYRDLCKAHEALERENLFIKLKERQLRDDLSRKETKLEETSRQLEHANHVMSENQTSLDECRAALIESNNFADRLQSTLNLQKRQISDYTETVFEVRSECKDLRHKLDKIEAEKCEAVLEASDLRQILTLKDTQIAELHERIAELSKKASKSCEQRHTVVSSRVGLRKSTLEARADLPFIPVSGLSLWDALNEVALQRQEPPDLQLPAPILAPHTSTESNTPIQNFLRKRPPSLLVIPSVSPPKHFSSDSRGLFTISELLYDAEEEEDLADSKYYEQFLRDMDLLKWDVETQGSVGEVVSRLFISEYGFEADDLALFGKLALVKDGSTDIEDFKHAVSLVRNKLKEKAESTIVRPAHDVNRSTLTSNLVLSSAVSASAASPHYQHNLSPTSFHPPKMFSQAKQSEKAVDDKIEEIQNSGKDAVFQGGLTGQGALRFHIPKRSSQLVLAS